MHANDFKYKITLTHLKTHIEVEPCKIKWTHSATNLQHAKKCTCINHHKTISTDLPSNQLNF